MLRAGCLREPVHIYIFGGRSGRATVEESPTLNNILVFDIETENWEEVIADTVKRGSTVRTAIVPSNDLYWAVFIHFWWMRHQWSMK
jgi:hypothetical protein